MKKKKDNIEPMSYVQIDRQALTHNFRQIKKLAAENPFKMPSRPKKGGRQEVAGRVMAVVKADAYGHGVERIAPLLEEMKVGYLGVSDIPEAIHLRELGVKTPVLIFENALPEYAEVICRHDFIASVCTHELAHALNTCARKAGKQINVHVKVDTGMGRLGVWHKDAFDFIQQIARLRNLTIHGIYTHFPVADTDKKFTQTQIDQLYALVKKLDKAGLIIPFIHASNSMGLAGYKTHVLNMFRPGLMLYGFYPHERLRKKITLKPVMSVHSRVIFIKDIEKGRGISYGRTFVAKKAMTVATIPIGYKDGYLRALSNKAHMLIGGEKCRVLGRVTMDQTVVDITRVKPARLGMPAVVLGSDGKNVITGADLAGWAGTINYEIGCSLGNNMPRRYR